MPRNRFPGSQDLPTDAPLGIVGNPCCGVEVARLDPVTLMPTRPRADLGEYHDTYSFSPNGRAIAFGISAAPSDGGGGRVGIRLVDAREPRSPATSAPGSLQPRSPGSSQGA